MLCLLPFLVHDFTTAYSPVNHELKEREGQLRRVEKENDDLQMKIQLQYSRYQVSRGPTGGKEAKSNKRKARARKRVKEEKEEYEKRMQSFLDEALKSERT